MSTLTEIFRDIFIIIKVVLYHIYTLFELLYREFVPLKSIKGENVLITGAVGGLGKILVKEFLKLGCNVVCVDLKRTHLFYLKNEIEKEFDSDIAKRAHFYELDVTLSDSVKISAEEIKKNVGKIDILINNAGIMNQGKLFLELTEQDVKNIFNVNTFAHFWLCREFLPDMIHENKGHIVNVSSVCGLVGGYKITDYCSSKFATTGFTESLRTELRVLNSKNKIIVSGVYPLHIKTKMFNGADITCLKWLNMSMEPEFAAATIVHGVLAEKESIFVPRIVYFFACAKYLLPAKALDYVQKCLDFSGSMNSYKKAN